MMGQRFIALLAFAAGLGLTVTTGTGFAASPQAQAPASFAGSFLASHFAQSQNDWQSASRYLEHVLKTDPTNPDLLRRSMILSMGAGDIRSASQRASDLFRVEKDNSLAALIMIVDDMAANKMDEAAKQLAAMPAGDITDFIRPLLNGWIRLGRGESMGSDSFNETTIHAYSAGLMALYKGDANKAADYAAAIVAVPNLSPYDSERAGDLFAAAGKNDRALKAYQGAVEENVRNWSLEQKTAAVKDGRAEDLKRYISAYRVKNAAQGAAVAMYDMARVLFQEQSDASTKLFSQMALVLDPSLTDARLLMANMMARIGRYDEAISYFSGVAADNETWLEIQHHIADLLQDAGRTPEALALLNKLFKEKNDVEALIRIGDIQRNQKHYSDALTAYNHAAKVIGGAQIPEEYWYLLYARGMAYERQGDWTHAESDLKAALTYRPNHPYLLNYLAYGWADQGINLKESLELLERAASLRPGDGYIADSLGWVLFRMGRYEEAMTNLENAVELMPYDATLNDHLGDAYWKMGRYREARFQWQRALSNAGDNESFKEVLSAKLNHGPTTPEVKEARTTVASPDEPPPATAQ